jgi:hypothetical protein
MESGKHIHNISVLDTGLSAKEETGAKGFWSKMTLAIRSQYGSEDQTFEPCKVLLELWT